MKARHPLAPLTVGETAAATRLALDACPGARLVYCALQEPARETVLGWDGGAVPRLARCVLYDRPARMTWLVTAAVDTRVVTSRVPVPGVQPPIMAEEWAGNADQIKADPGFRAALARRGVTDLSRVQVDPWPASNFGLEVDRSGRRLARGVAYVLDGPGSNPYARPVENLVAVLDRDTGEVVELIDGDVVPIPADPGRYDAAAVGARPGLAPLQILQPDGPGFTVDDGQLRWGPWQLRVSMHPIEGLVLHEICYVEGGRARPLLYRASMAEMVMPYGSTAPGHWWKPARSPRNWPGRTTSTCSVSGSTRASTARRTPSTRWTRSAFRPAREIPTATPSPTAPPCWRPSRRRGGWRRRIARVTGRSSTTGR